ncbi:aspartyl/asparaginyl beta-hydroxylase domain-containing protein [Streptomyces sp. WMMB 322]|uniref:aspartyl/asparaginyl beta-hydroxylase domain-containing protein n=1 Tax=Streptomyces sp. WMMB 322 TaxID=1286821 RepID=UPI0006E1EBF2|nr:aspartyl/asparaginyl beta-hydroxylase domain-containing protein [Streptomyces sp. WMMB 322]SCK13792.1 aspartate beta-hydroxylase [Streptomyces sp. WMMB 322]
MEKLWITEGPREFEKWLSLGKVDPKDVERIREGLDITAQGRIREFSGSQDPTIFFPGLTSRPWWGRHDFPWLEDLEGAAETITDELRAGGRDTSSSVPSPELAEAGHWRAQYLCCIGRPYTRNLPEFPRTLKALAPIPGATDSGMTYFSTVLGGTHIAPHSGFSNAHLRCHLSLITTEGSRIRVADEERVWQEGKAFVFDDSFEHEVWNEGSERRTVLLFDFWHPDLSAPEIEALQHMMGVWRRMFSRQFWTRQMNA